MKVRILALPAIVLALSVATATTTLAQDAGMPQDSNQPSHARGSGQRGGRGMWGGGNGVMGRGVMGTVTEVAPDHLSVKTEAGELYTVHYSVNTRIMKGGGDPRRGQGDNEPPSAPVPIKATDIKVGDAIAASGEMDAAAKSVGAIVIFQIDPERAKQLREMQANYGKTWLMGRVTTVNDVNVTLQGGPDNADHTFVADENTTFRKRREPITLADVQVGDIVRVEGSVKNGAFLATTVAVMGPNPQGGPRQRDNQAGPPQ